MSVLRVRWVGRMALLTALGIVSAVPALSQSANFDSLTLSRGFSRTEGTVRGYTQGAFSLSAIANRDQDGNLCLGFADSVPDHIMVLEEDFPQLTLQVDSGGGDTTLVMQGPNNTVRCGDDTGRNPDASIEATDLQAGTYQIWVGAFDSGVRYDYRLTIGE